MTPKKKSKPVIGRPKLAKGDARVVLPAQRIAPSTMEIIEARADSVGGIGRLLDSAMIAWVELERQMGVAPPK